jgi:hypothetical protein
MSLFANQSDMICTKYWLPAAAGLLLRSKVLQRPSARLALRFGVIARKFQLRLHGGIHKIAEHARLTIQKAHNQNTLDLSQYTGAYRFGIYDCPIRSDFEAPTVRVSCPRTALSSVVALFARSISSVPAQKSGAPKYS